MDSREQLLNTLMRDLDAVALPERFSADKQAQIMKGRKSQADIDAGRKAIAENEQQYQDALKRRGELQRQISVLQERIGTAKAEAEANSPYEQARQIALFGVPAAAGMGLGYAKGSGLSKALRERARERAGNIKGLASDVRAGAVAGDDAARTAKALRLTGATRHGVGPMAFGAGLAGVGAAQRALAPQLTNNPTGQDVMRALGGLESGVGAGLVLQQVGSMLSGLPQPRASDVATITASPAPPTPAAPAAPKPGTRADLYRQAKAQGLPVTTRMKKAELEDALAKKLRENSRRSRSVTKAFVPLAAGASVYDALRTPAQAGEGEAAPMASRPAAAAAGGAAAAGTAGLMAGGSRLARALAEVPGARAGLRVAGRVAGPVAGAITAYDAGQAVLGGLAQGEDVAGADAELRQGNRPFFAQQQALQRQAYGEQPAAPAEADLAPIAEAAAQDPEFAEMLRELIMTRAAEAGAAPIDNAMNSAAVAGRGGGMVEALRNLAMR